MIRIAEVVCDVERDQLVARLFEELAGIALNQIQMSRIQADSERRTVHPIQNPQQIRGKRLCGRNIFNGDPDAASLNGTTEFLERFDGKLFRIRRGHPLFPRGIPSAVENRRPNAEPLIDFQLFFQKIQILLPRGRIGMCHIRIQLQMPLRQCNAQFAGKIVQFVRRLQRIGTVHQNFPVFIGKFRIPVAAVCQSFNCRFGGIFQKKRGPHSNFFHLVLSFPVRVSCESGSFLLPYPVPGFFQAERRGKSVKKNDFHYSEHRRALDGRSPDKRKGRMCRGCTFSPPSESAGLVLIISEEESGTAHRSFPARCRIPSSGSRPGRFRDCC